jgi:hypothetical protein
MNIVGWKCIRCKEVVDYANFRCGCTESPSPWEPIYEMETDHAKLKWYPFDSTKGSYQKRPPIYKLVLLAFPPKEGAAPATVVGYMKNSAGDKQSPFFISPGHGGIPTHWCDCLPDNFGEHGIHPYWQFVPLSARH